MIGCSHNKSEKLTEPDKDCLLTVDNFGSHHHACLIYSTVAEQMALVVPLIQIGIQRQELCIYFVERDTADSISMSLESAGLDVKRHQSEGTLQFIFKDQFYWQSEGFCEENVIQNFIHLVSDAKNKGFRALRVFSDVTHKSSSMIGLSRLLRYESRINGIFPETDFLAICQYNRNLFPAEHIQGVIETHPFVICNGLINKNRFWIPPAEYLKQPDSQIKVERMLAQIENTTRQQMALKEREAQLQTLVTNLATSEERFRLITNACNDGIWDYNIKNGSLWRNKRFEQIFGTVSEIQSDYEWWMRQIHPKDRAHVLNQFQDAVQGNQDYISLNFTFIRPQGRELHLIARAFIVRNSAGKAIRIVGAVMDITSYREAKEELHKVSAKLVSIQEEERRHIARELHDSTAQKLASLILSLGQAEDSQDLHDSKHLIQDCLKSANDCIQEIRTLSYLLHPPLLDELGLEAALDTYLTGFEKRSGIKVSLDVQGSIHDIPQNVALALFRVVQESLGNISRHSKSPTASVQVAKLHNRAVMEILDQGHGIPQKVLAQIKSKHIGVGVGILGMMERLEQLGGFLEIDSSVQGTLIRAIIPLDTLAPRPR